MTQDIAEKPENKWITRVAHLIFRLTRPMTLGVRGVVFNPEGHIFLVRHTYVPGWHFPGGGVEPGETLEQALAKELREEGNIEILDAADLHGMFFNRHVSRRDHVAVYVVRRCQQTKPRLPDAEIAECGFFPLDGLPETTTRGTRRRLAEILGESAKSQEW